MALQDVRLSSHVFGASPARGLLAPGVVGLLLLASVGFALGLDVGIFLGWAALAFGIAVAAGFAGAGLVPTVGSLWLVGFWWFAFPRSSVISRVTERARVATRIRECWAAGTSPRVESCSAEPNSASDSGYSSQSSPGSPGTRSGWLSFYEERIPAFTPGVNPTTLTQSITDGRLDIPRTSTSLS